MSISTVLKIGRFKANEQISLHPSVTTMPWSRSLNYRGVSLFFIQDALKRNSYHSNVWEYVQTK